MGSSWGCIISSSWDWLTVTLFQRAIPQISASKVLRNPAAYALGDIFFFFLKHIWERNNTAFSLCSSHLAQDSECCVFLLQPPFRQLQNSWKNAGGSFMWRGLHMNCPKFRLEEHFWSQWPLAGSGKIKCHWEISEFCFQVFLSSFSSLQERNAIGEAHWFTFLKFFHL